MLSISCFRRFLSERPDGISIVCLFVVSFIVSAEIGISAESYADQKILLRTLFSRDQWSVQMDVLGVESSQKDVEEFLKANPVSTREIYNKLNSKANKLGVCSLQMSKSGEFKIETKLGPDATPMIFTQAWSENGKFYFSSNKKTVNVASSASSAIFAGAPISGTLVEPLFKLFSAINSVEDDSEFMNNLQIQKVDDEFGIALKIQTPVVGIAFYKANDILQQFNSIFIVAVRPNDFSRRLEVSPGLSKIEEKTKAIRKRLHSGESEKSMIYIFSVRNAEVPGH